MKFCSTKLRLGFFAMLVMAVLVAATHGQVPVPAGTPVATVDLTTEEGVRLVKGQWRYSDTRIVETSFRAPGPDQQPTGPTIKTYDYEPKAGGADFDDSRWEAIRASSLSERRATGRLCFNWYRLKLTIPEQVNGVATRGLTVVLQTTLDDYAEIWVDGELTRYLGQPGGSVIAGWNAPNRLLIGREVQPGQPIQLAIFGINGPLSNPPTNFIWVREARLEFFPTALPGPLALTPSEVNVQVLSRNAAAMEKIVGPNPKMFKLAEGFQFTEGPVWINASDPAQSHLLLSDPNSNVIWKFTPQGERPGKLEIFRTPSGYSGADIAEYTQPGSNGLTLDPAGRLTINEHGNHRVTRLERDGSLTVLADQFGGRRLNSPNDLVYRSDGTLYFTDPPFGLPKFFDDPRKELPYSGVYALKAGQLQLLTKEFTGPNGLAFSPDERTLYVGNWDQQKKVVMTYDVQPDGTLRNGKVFFDFTATPGEEAIDGIKVDQAGNVYVSGPGGLWVLASTGEPLGTIVAPKHVHNMAWGDADGKTLYLCARSGLYRMRLNIPGVRPRDIAQR